MKRRQILGIIFIAVAIPLSIITRFSYLRDMGMKENGEAAQAVIARIDEESHIDPTDDSLCIDRTVYVDYVTRDGTERRDVQLGYYRDGMEQGDKVKIYYMPENPLDISCAELSDSPAIYIYLFSVDAVLCVAGLALIVSSIMSEKKKTA